MSLTTIPAVAPTYNLTAKVGKRLWGIAQNCRGTSLVPLLSIQLAQANGYILADASGQVGFIPLAPGQRDPHAIPAKDKDNLVGE